MRFRPSFVPAALGFFALAPLLAQEKAEESKDPEDRLLEAQLLEVSTGDLEKAKRVYEEIRADARVPEAARARAQLYLARCHRKLGEIETAKKLLEELVKGPPQDREVLRQARSFLRELQGGRPESPEFDWLKELEKSPEIQARVFDLAMDLVDPRSEEAARARNQLIALGTVAVPVIERVLETSRDPRHRQLLAVVLLHSGRYERLPLALDPKLMPRDSVLSSLETFRQSVPALSDEERGRLADALRKLPASAETDPYRDALLIQAGDSSDFPGKLKGLEKLPMQSWSWIKEPVEAVLGREPEAAGALADRILDPACPWEPMKLYVDLLLKSAPDRLQAEHWTAFLSERPSLPEVPAVQMNYASYLDSLERRGAFLVLRDVAARGNDRLKNEVVNLFHNLYLRNEGKKLVDVPEGWAAVLRAAARKGGVATGAATLQHFAGASDRALPEFIAFLKNRETEFPEYSGSNLESGPDWRPSPRYVEAMAGLLDSKDPVTVQIALSGLSRAPAGTSPEVFAEVERLARESGDLEVRMSALQVLVHRFSEDPGTGPQLAGALLLEHERSLESEANPSPAPPPGTVASRRIPQRAIRGRHTPLARLMDSTIKNLDQDGLLRLYPHVLDLADSEKGARFHESFISYLDYNQALPILIKRLASIRSPELRKAVTFRVTSNTAERPRPELITFLREVANDRTLREDARLRAFLSSAEPPFDWFDWSRLLGSDDPVAGALLLHDSSDDSRYGGRKKAFGGKFWAWVKDRPEEERRAIYQAALSSPQEAVRHSVVRAYPLDRPDAPEVFSEVFKDRSHLVQSAAIDRMKSVTRADMEPVFIRLLGHEDRKVRLLAIESLTRFASQQSIEPLALILDDPDIEIRGQAIRALKEIRQALEERVRVGRKVPDKKE